MRSTWCRRLWTVLLSFFCLLSSALPLHAESTVVRVGFYQNGKLFYQTADGIYSGYDADYLYEIAKYTGWTYEFVDCGSFDNMLAELEAGKIDVVPALFYTEDRAERFLYSEDDMGKINVTIITAAADTRYSYGDLDSMQGIRIGVLKQSGEEADVKAWVQENGIDADIQEYGRLEEMQQAVAGGSLDAIGISYIGASTDYKVIAEFSPHNLYFLMPMKNTALMTQLNQAMAQISVKNPYFKSDVYNRYLTVRRDENPVFSSEQKQYVASAGTITVALPEDSAPLSYTENGEVKGALADYYSYLSSLCGLHLKLVPAASQAAAVDMLKSGKVQVIAFLPEEPSVMAAEGIRLTDTYLQLPMVQLSRSRSRAAASIAIPAPMVSLYQGGSTAHAGTLQEYTYPTEAQCLSAMNADEVDSIFCSSVYASYVVSRSRPGRYTVTALTGYTSNMTMGILQDGDQMLYSILNRCIQYTDSSTVNELITQYSQTYDNSLAGIVNRLPAGVILVTAVIMAAMVTGLIAALVLLYQRTRREKALAEEKEKVEAEAKANAIRSSFFGAISHDMRTPLNAITGFIRLARKNGITPKQREDYLDKAESSSRLLLDLIDDTLTVSKAESGKLELRPQPMSLQALGVSLLTPIRELAAQKHVEIISDSSAVRSRMVMGDQLQLQKIYLNLMNNAVKYTPSGGHVWITARDEPVGGEDPDFVVEIRDDGIGMSEEYLPHLFEPFSQERRPGYESVGTGLGLSIVHQLVDLMHGTITVVSRKDEGTCFTVRVHLPEVKDIPVVPQPAMDAGAETHALSGKKVLVCEDNVLNREIAVELLKERGMTAAEAENGQIGVSMFQASGPGEFFAVLMDIRMPVMDGYEATGAIRALDRPDARTVPIIAMTADAYEEDVRRCMKAGMNAHIAKPVDPEVLFRTLIRCQPSHHQN